MRYFAASFAAAATLAAAHPLYHEHHSHTVSRSLPGDQWHHELDHPVNKLFARDPTTTGTAAVGTPAWLAQYPNEWGSPSYQTADLPAAWAAAYNAAVAAGKVPKIPPSVLDKDGNPVYPDGLDASGQEVCSATPKCRAPGDIWDAPDGVIGISFDDGPTDVSEGLYTFLADHGHMKATHFMIGRNIAQQPAAFLMAFQQGGDIACHTWTHPYMTTLNDTAVVAELGWTLQIIHDSTGGRVPKFWRPPYGDADNRVRAIAKEVFGLTTVIWNQDTEDWSAAGAPNPQTVVDTAHANLDAWMSGPKSPGLIILEHELDNYTVGIFQNFTFPNIAKYNWSAQSIPQMLYSGVYQNAIGNIGSVTQTLAVAGAATNPPAAAPPAPTTSQPSSPIPPPPSAPSSSAPAGGAGGAGPTDGGDDGDDSSDNSTSNAKPPGNSAYATAGSSAWTAALAVVVSLAIAVSA